MTNEKGEIFFVGKDMAKALGYSNTRDALSRHVDAEDKGTVAFHDPAYETRAIIINESGLYALVLSSKLPKAKKFKRWVTSEVLPQIRMTGGYIHVRGKGQKDRLAPIAESATDIHEDHNLADDYPEKLAELKALVYKSHIDNPHFKVTLPE